MDENELRELLETLRNITEEMQALRQKVDALIELYNRDLHIPNF